MEPIEDLQYHYTYPSYYGALSFLPREIRGTKILPGKL